MKKVVRNINIMVLILVALILVAYSSIDNFGSDINKPGSHPILILTKTGVKEIREEIGHLPLFDNTFNKVKKEVEQEITKGIEVPLPKDPAGGYTHRKHKRNYLVMQQAGVLFQLTGEEKYGVFVRDMLLEYAEMYPDLGLHPIDKSYSRGKIFWQCLNDANWLVYASQAYDCIYDWISENERSIINEQLFRPYADFLSIQTPHFFNRIHNHSTWAVAGVGMIGLVLKDEGLVERALYGLKNDGIDESSIDNDGGMIKSTDTKKAGFLAQIDHLFSPDGYYTEGPYYQRYAMYPFMVFAASLQSCKPELKIFEYRNHILRKALKALVNLSSVNGEFYPLNDAQKGMSVSSNELVSAVDLVYHFDGDNSQLLSLAKKQNRVLLNDAGLSIAMGLKGENEKELEKKSVNITDGIDGLNGGIGILRSRTKNPIELVMKYTSQGMGHGHFDKLSFSLYDDGNEVIQDYGMARYVNIKHKRGGRYLPENKSFAKQTIAHNTLVINEISNYNGKVKTGNQYHPVKHFFNAKEERIHIISAKDDTAYKGVKMQRTMALITENDFEKPIVVDVFKVQSKTKNQYDLPYYYLGQLMSFEGFENQSSNNLKALGSKNGYQHIWNEAEGKPVSNNVKITWESERRFYSLTSLVNSNDKLLLGRIGANDPEYNLRKDPVFIHRKKEADNEVFISVLEPHGNYSPVTELAKNAFSQIKKVKLNFDNEQYTIVEIEHVNGNKWQLIIVNDNADDKKWHELKIDKINRSWRGPYHYYKI